MGWHPWRVLGEQYPRVVARVADLPEPGARYYPRHDVVLLDRRLGQAGRRCALTHEIVHIERGDTACTGWHAQRQERAVERESARRLITTEELVRGLQWSQDEHELADELWVDVPTIRARLDGLTPDERAEIASQIDDDQGVSQP